jgi:hypothetical protein
MAKNASNKKSGKTTVETAKIVAIAAKLGLASEPKAGWTNFFIQETGSEKRPSQRILVHTGKKGTNCIELVGFEVEAEGVVSHPCPPAKTMTQMVNCDLEEAQIKRAFYAAGKRMLELYSEAKIAAELVEQAAVQTAAEQTEEPAAEQVEIVAEAAQG